ncbi:DUF192 domain-containing protein [Idiomarina sp.]|uniref:DUF192 domain-containing protein n=1 Tax=Idiomarina sp. TaxID=1874361 RepID=UPI0025BB0947|nr:DUF192 domain-containing protein [Idiomarina sp.]NQZ03806.1 DUF192 domain-containing protein [Idiomarina sp.]
MTSTIIWPDTQYLTGYFSRLRGVTALTEMTPLSAIWFPRCRAIHTLGMRFPIDVVALDKEGVIINVKRFLTPNRIYIQKRAHTVIELCALSPYPLESWIGAKLDLEARSQNEEKYWATRIMFERMHEHTTVASVRAISIR